MFKDVDDVIEYLKGRRGKKLDYLGDEGWEGGYKDGLTEAIVALRLIDMGDNK